MAEEADSYFVVTCSVFFTHLEHLQRLRHTGSVVAVLCWGEELHSKLGQPGFRRLMQHTMLWWNAGVLFAAGRANSICRDVSKKLYVLIAPENITVK